MVLEDRDDLPESLLRDFPAVAALEALQAFARHGQLEQLEALSAAMDRIAAIAGVRGLALEVDAPPLAPIELAVGSLEQEAARDDGPTSEDDEEPDSRVRFELVGEDGRLLGCVRADGEPVAAMVAARTIELAVRGAWASAEVRRATERLDALDDATRTVSAELDLDRVLQLIVDRLRGLVGARYAALGISNAVGRIERFITSGVTADERTAIGPPPEGHGLLGVIIRDGRSLRVDDIAAHAESYGFPANHPPMRTLLGVPIVVEQRPVGNLYLTEKERGRPFTEDDQRLVEMFALRAGIAIDNARLHEAVGRLAVADERERIGRDLHDGIIQSIYGVSLSLEDVPELMSEAPGDATARVDDAIDALHHVIGDIRQYILDLRPGLGRDDDPVTGIAQLAAQLRLNAVIDVEVDLEPGAALARGLDPARAADLVSMAREALSNVARHSAATRCEVLLRADDGAVVLEVRDNGRGFDLESREQTDEHGRHQGLRNVRERARGARGHLRTESRPGGGTRIIVSLPAGAASPGDAGSEPSSGAEGPP